VAVKAPLGMVIVPLLAKSEVIKILTVAKLEPSTCVGEQSQNSFPLLEKSCAFKHTKAKENMVNSKLFLISI